MAPDDDLTLALALCDLADGITLGRYRAADLAVETKPDLTPVTEADRDVEQAIRARLAAERPGDAVVGEEYGESVPDFLAGSAAPKPEGARRRWIIDPIDGTKNYVRGVPAWATLLALQVDGEGVIGVCSAPALGRRWWARRGAGAWVAGEPVGAGAWVAGEPVGAGAAGAPPAGGARRLAVSRVAALADASLSWAGIEDWDEIGRFDELVELGRRCWRTRAYGDLWTYMLVAEGAVDLGIDARVSLWDLAAPQVIVEEAGGRFTDLAGIARPDGGDAIASNGLLHDAALALIGR